MGNVLLSWMIKSFYCTMLLFMLVINQNGKVCWIQPLNLRHRQTQAAPYFLYLCVDWVLFRPHDVKPTQPQWQRDVLDVGRCGAARTTLYFSSLQGIVLQSSSASSSAALQSTHYNQHLPRLEVNPELTVFLIQELPDRKINRLAPPLKVMGGLQF